MGQNIQVTHIHLMMVILLKYAVGEVIGQIKQSTVCGIMKKFVWFDKVYWRERVVWSPNYFFFAVGLDEKQIIEYIRRQSD